MNKYSMEIAWSEEDGVFVATCPELGDLSAFGATHFLAALELRIAVDLALEVMEEDGEEPPEPIFKLAPGSEP